MFVLRTSDVATGVAVMCCFATLNSAVGTDTDGIQNTILYSEYNKYGEKGT